MVAASVGRSELGGLDMDSGVASVSGFDDGGGIGGFGGGGGGGDGIVAGSFEPLSDD